MAEETPFQPMKVWVGNLKHGAYAGQLKEIITTAGIAVAHIFVRHSGSDQDSFACVELFSEEAP